MRATDSRLTATLDAVTLLQAHYDAMFTDPTVHPIVRQIVLRALLRLGADARRMLTGVDDAR